MRIIDKKKRELAKKYPESLRLAKSAYYTERCPEGVGYSDNNLLRNPYFAGFYLKGKTESRILKVLKHKFPDKILFDGEKITKIGDIR